MTIKRRTSEKTKTEATDNIHDTMTFTEMERILVRKHYMMELSGDPGAAKVLDQLMKVKELRSKERQFALEEDANKVKPAVLVMPMVTDLDQWQTIAAKQQKRLISETAKIKLK